MRQRSQPTHVAAQDLELLDIKVTRDGGAVRYLEGRRYGLVTSVYRSEVVTDSGPEPHTHPYSEFFIIHAGRARFFVGHSTIDAKAGDVVIIPAGAVHHFVNPGSETLQQTAIHEAPASIVDIAERDPT